MNRRMQTSEEANPLRIPYRVLNTGAKIPAIGLGTFGSDRFSPDQVARAVRGAIACGYRHIDCASVYGNEIQIGQALREALADGTLKREQLWITSKVWNDMHSRVAQACRKSLQDLGLEYLDLYLVHWPFPNFHPPQCDVTSRSPDARPYLHEDYMKTWRQMEALVQEGLVRHIGTSNMTIPKLTLLLRDAAVRPVCNEMELHPHFQQPQLFQFCLDNEIVPIGYCPLGSPARPERDRTEEDTVDLEDPVIVRIAERHGISPAAVCIRWAIGRGQIPIPFSLHHYRENLLAAAAGPLSDEEMEQIRRIDKNCRLIKGQVFLWKENQSWEDLWDPNGQITPP